MERNCLHLWISRDVCNVVDMPYPCLEKGYIQRGILGDKWDLSNNVTDMIHNILLVQYPSTKKLDLWDLGK
jgi:hypothetical protein